MERRPVPAETRQVSFARPATFTVHAVQYLKDPALKLVRRDPKDPVRVCPHRFVAR